MTREHNIKDASCWCDPDYYVWCRECNTVPGDPTCWLCRGEGKLLIADGFKRRRGDQMFILHRDTAEAKGFLYVP